MEARRGPGSTPQAAPKLRISSALHAARSEELSLLLLEAKADPNARDLERRTPLHVPQPLSNGLHLKRPSSALLDIRAPPASPDHRTPPGASPPQLGGSPWPQEPASACSQGEECALLRRQVALISEEHEQRLGLAALLLESAARATMASTLPEDTALPAAPDHRNARGSPTHPGSAA